MSTPRALIGHRRIIGSLIPLIGSVTACSSAHDSLVVEGGGCPSGSSATICWSAEVGGEVSHSMQWTFNLPEGMSCTQYAAAGYDGRYYFNYSDLPALGQGQPQVHFDADIPGYHGPGVYAIHREWNPIFEYTADGLDQQTQAFSPGSATDGSLEVDPAGNAHFEINQLTDGLGAMVSITGSLVCRD